MEKENRFYWIRLKTDFFDQDAIDFLMSQENGCQYVTLYLMLCLKTANTGGELTKTVGDIIVPYDVKKIVRDTKYFDADTVMIALGLFTQLGLVYEEKDGTLAITGISHYVGSESAKPEAIRKRRQRAKEKAENVTNCHGDVVTKNHIEIRDKSIEIRDKSIDVDNRESVYNTSPTLARENPSGDSYPALEGAQTYGLYNNVVLTDAEFEQLAIDYPHEHKDMIENLSVYMRKTGKSYADHYATLCDWKRKDDAKKYQKPINKTAQELDDFYERAQSWAEGD